MEIVRIAVLRHKPGETNPTLSLSAAYKVDADCSTMQYEIVQSIVKGDVWRGEKTLDTKEAPDFVLEAKLVKESA